MRFKVIGGAIAAVVFPLSAAVFAQSAPGSQSSTPGAQQGPTASQQQSGSSPQTSPATRNGSQSLVTVIGCLRPVDQSAAGANVGTTLSDIQYELTSARMSSGAGAAASGGRDANGGNAGAANAGASATGGSSAGATGTSGTGATATSGAGATNGTSAASGGANATDSGALRGTTYRLTSENIEELRPHENHQVEVSGTLVSDGQAGASASAGGGSRLRVDAVRMIAASCEAR
jgi:hypothetical protein